MLLHIRKSVIPKSLPDGIVTTFVILIIPLIYYFELFIVLPTFYEMWSSWYIFHFIMGTYILYNITTNFVATIICDTSIKGWQLPSTLENDWHFCAVCESTAPPRSWHCITCNTCILKRDHHCYFTSCCIGHYNLRYFLMFVLYVFIATVYSTYYNNFFMWSFVDLRSWMTLVNIMFPLAMLFVELTPHQFYLFLYLIVLICCMFTGVLLYYHSNLILRGLLTYERKSRHSKYDYGSKQNIIEALGERWYLVWISPFIESKLPHDGIHWEVKNDVKGVKDL